MITLEFKSANNDTDVGAHMCQLYFFFIVVCMVHKNTKTQSQCGDSGAGIRSRGAIQLTTSWTPVLLAGEATNGSLP